MQNTYNTNQTKLQYFIDFLQANKAESFTINDVVNSNLEFFNVNDEDELKIAIRDLRSLVMTEFRRDKNRQPHHRKMANIHRTGSKPNKYCFEERDYQSTDSDVIHIEKRKMQGVHLYNDRVLFSMPVLSGTVNVYDVGKQIKIYSKGTNKLAHHGVIAGFVDTSTGKRKNCDTLIIDLHGEKIVREYEFAIRKN